MTSLFDVRQSAARLTCLCFLAFLPATPVSAEVEAARQYILANRMGTATSRLESGARKEFEEVKRALPDVPNASIRIGVAYNFSYFQMDDDEALFASLQSVLRAAEETDTPVLIQLDG